MAEASAEAKKALTLLKETVRIADAEASAGMYLITMNKNEEALAHFKRALALDPNSLPALEGYANADGLFQQPEEAMRTVRPGSAAKARAG